MTDYKNTAKIFKAYCDETRVHILTLLQNGERCACELLEELHQSQSGLSYHMKILQEAGIIHARTEGKWTYYRICSDGRRRALQRLEELTAPQAIAKEKNNTHQEDSTRCT